MNSKKKAETTRLVEQLQQVHEGGAWHGPSVRDALEGVTASAATARPIPAGHTIAEIVHHLRVVADNVRADLTGQAGKDEVDWPDAASAPRSLSAEAWRAAVSLLETTQRALREAAAALPEARLHETVPGKSHSYWYEIVGLVNHDVYHAGQIALLRKASSRA